MRATDSVGNPGCEEVLYGGDVVGSRGTSQPRSLDGSPKARVRNGLRRAPKRKSLSTFADHRLCARVCAKPFTSILPVNPPTSQRGRCYYVHSAGENPGIREAIASAKFTQLEKEQDSHIRADHKPRRFCLPRSVKCPPLVPAQSKAETLSEHLLHR